MKPFFVVIILTTLIVGFTGCDSSSSVKKAAEKSGKVLANLTGGYTLTWQTYSAADTLVGNLLDDANGSDNKTSFLFSHDWIKNVRRVLESENCDGIRIYFAKENGKNSIVIVATTKGEPNPYVKSGTTHEDYFTNDQYFSSPSNGAFTPENDLLISSGATLHGTASPCATDNCLITKLNHHIKCDDAFEMVKKFKKGTISSSSEWFSTKEIQNIDKELDAAKAVNVNANGIRIYMAQAGKRQAFIITTTKEDQGILHKDYYECYKKDEDKEGTDDNGELCPNHCEGSAFGN